LLDASNVWEADTMGRPIGSVNKAKPFADMLRVALLSGGGRRLRTIAEKLAEKAEQGDIQAIREVGDRLDGMCRLLSAATLQSKLGPTSNSWQSSVADHVNRRSSLRLFAGLFQRSRPPWLRGGSFLFGF
jgi:hypothetical protein